MHGDWVVAIASIVAAIVGGAAIFFFERLRATKRRVQFVVSEPQTITGALQGHGREFKVTLGDQSASELNVSSVSVTNTGNTQIENLTFEITIPGERRIMLAECMTANDTLQKSVQITFSNAIPQTNPIFSVALGFFNPKESFVLKTLVDGAAAACKVSCRLPGTMVTVANQEELLARRMRRTRWTEIVFYTVTVFFAVVSMFAAYYVNFRSTRDLDNLTSRIELETELERRMMEFEKRLSQSDKSGERTK